MGLYLFRLLNHLRHGDAVTFRFVLPAEPIFGHHLGEPAYDSEYAMTFRLGLPRRRPKTMRLVIRRTG